MDPRGRGNAGHLGACRARRDRPGLKYRAVSCTWAPQRTWSSAMASSLERSLAAFVQGLQAGSVKRRDDPTDLGQSPRVFRAPGLTAQPWWDPPERIWALAEESRPAITQELRALLAAHPAHTQRHGSDVRQTRRGRTGRVLTDPNDGWRSHDLLQDARWDEGTCSRCPATVAFLRQLQLRGALCDCSLARAYFSILTAGKAITPHHGRSNVKLRLQIPLLVGREGYCEMKVGGVGRRYREGLPFLFDDSFLHEVRSCSPTDRVVLLCDLWHPQLSTGALHLRLARSTHRV